MRVALYQSLLSLFIVLTPLAHAHDVRGQKVLEQKVTLLLTNVDVEKALEKIEKMTKVKFMYNPQVFSNQKYTFRFQDEALSGVLEKILTPIRWFTKLCRTKLS